MKIDPSAIGPESEVTGNYKEDSPNIPDFSVAAATQNLNGSTTAQSDDHPPVSRSQPRRRSSISPEIESVHSETKAPTPDRRKSTSSANSVSVANSEQESEHPKTPSVSSDSDMNENVSRTRKMLKAINGASHGINKETRKVLGFFRNRLRSKRGRNETSVKEIHINPEVFDDKWASRGASGSSGSRASSGSMGLSNSSRESSTLEVVHDMEDEYNPEYR